MDSRQFWRAACYFYNHQNDVRSDRTMGVVGWIVVVYLVLINVVTFITFGVDKSRARKHAWRIPEKRLFFLAIIGGSVGAIAGMYFFRHKTRHWYFVIGMPLILILQLAGAWFFNL
jgi:uncharacterized membrane protein YsdA (DUF1294 family)